MIEEHEMLRILNTSLEKTKSGSVQWREGDGSALFLSFPHSTLVIRNKGHLFTLEALNTAGELVGRLSSTDQLTHSKLSTLHKEGLRKARHVDETLKDILDGLGEDQQ